MFTVPAACGAVFAVIFMALFTTTFVAAVPPIVTTGPLWKPLPVMVTAVPPLNGPIAGLMAVTATAGSTVTFTDFVSAQPADVVTVTLRDSVPTAPAVKLIFEVPLPPVIVPFVIPQLYVAPAPAFATEALLPELVAIDAGVVIVALGNGLIVTVLTEDGELTP